MERADPILQKLRREKPEPILIKSTTLDVLPTRILEKTDTVEPSRPKLRKLAKDPKATKPYTLMLL
jgi:hypothetical protein